MTGGTKKTLSSELWHLAQPSRSLKFLCDLQVKETVGISGQEAADSASANAQYASETVKGYAKAGQGQAGAAAAKAKQQGSGYYDAAAEKAGKAADYVKDSASAGCAI